MGVRHLEGALDGWSADDQQTLAGLLHRLVDDMVATPITPKA